MQKILYALRAAAAFLSASAVMTMIMVAPANALEILRGEAVQGGLIILATAPGARLTANGKPVRVSADGHAAIGFSRDETNPVTLESRAPDGSRASLTITPRTRQYRVQRIDGLPPALVTPPAETLARIRRDSAEVARARAAISDSPAFARPFAWPVRGVITGVYGSQRILNGKPRAPHYGIDIAAPRGTEVLAPEAGIVRMADDLYFTGWTVILDHGHGVNSTLMHLDTITVKPGARVAKGETIGTVGSTGRSTGAHLDWRVNLFDKRLDPMLVAGPMPQ